MIFNSFNLLIEFSLKNSANESELKFHFTFQEFFFFQIDFSFLKKKFFYKQVYF